MVLSVGMAFADDTAFTGGTAWQDSSIVAQSMAAANLKCVIAHYPVMLNGSADKHTEKIQNA